MSWTVNRNGQSSMITNQPYTQVRYGRQRKKDPNNGSARWAENALELVTNITYGDGTSYENWNGSLTNTNGGIPPRSTVWRDYDGTIRTVARPPMTPNGSPAWFKNNGTGNSNSSYNLLAGTYLLMDMSFVTYNNQLFPFILSDIITTVHNQTTMSYGGQTYWGTWDKWYYYDAQLNYHTTYTTSDFSNTSWTLRLVIYFNDGTSTTLNNVNNGSTTEISNAIRNKRVNEIRLYIVLATGIATVPPSQPNDPWNYEQSQTCFNIDVFNFDISVYGGNMLGYNDPNKGTKNYMDVAMSYLGKGVTYNQDYRTQLNNATNPRADCSSYVGYCLGAGGVSGFSINDTTSSLYSKLSGYVVGSDFTNVQYGDILLMTTNAGFGASTTNSHACFAIDNTHILEVCGSAGQRNPCITNNNTRYNSKARRYVCRLS